MTDFDPGALTPDRLARMDRELDAVRALLVDDVARLQARCDAQDAALKRLFAANEAYRAAIQLAQRESASYLSPRAREALDRAIKEQAPAPYRDIIPTLITWNEAHPDVKDCAACEALKRLVEALRHDG